MEQVFLVLSTSDDLIMKAELSVEKENGFVWLKMFLKGMVMLEPALITNGPCGLESRQWPFKGILYSPPAERIATNNPFRIWT